MNARASWLLAGLAARLAFAVKLGDRHIQTDESGFRAIAAQFAGTGVIGIDGHAAAVAPVPAVFFGALMKLGDSLLWPRLALAFVGAMTAWLLSLAAEDLTGSKKAGRLALIAGCFYPFFLYYGGMVLSEPLYLVFVVPGLWWLCKPDTDARAAGAGLCLALAALCRAEAAYIMAVLWLFVAARWNWRPFVIGVVCWALPLFGWCLRNKAATGAFTLDSHGGMTLLHGTLLFEQNEIDTGVAMKAFETTELYKSSLALPEAERDALYKKEAFRFMRENPGVTLRQWGRKLVNFWRLYPRTDKAYAENARSSPSAGFPRWILTAVSLACEPLLIFGGLWGLWLLRDRAATLFPLWLWIAGTMGIHVLSVSQMRYRLPVMPVLILGLCYAAARAAGERIPD